MTPRRIVSLVPSVTEALTAFGADDRVVGVTRYCVRDAPPDARRVGGTKNPDLSAIADLRPDLVIGNTEENRPEDLEALRAAGLAVLETFPRTVADVAGFLRTVGAAVGAPRERVEVIAGSVDAALREAATTRPPDPPPALVLIWRKPWMGVGPGTYVSDLLRVGGLANVLDDDAERYPRVGPDDARLRGARVALLPSEPYAFSDDDVPALRELLGDEVALEFVDGETLTWHGPRTAEAVRLVAALAARYPPLK